MATNYPSAKEKKILQEQLNHVEFVKSTEELQEFKCNACRKIALEKHLVAKCGHWFCNNCNDEVHNRACPVKDCHNSRITSSTRSNDYENGVYSLEVFCKNRRLGCNLKIPLLNYLEHERNCPISVEITQASDNVIKSMRAEIDDLKRMVKSLHSNLTKAEENIKMNLYEERALKTDLQLMENKLNDIIAQKMVTERQKIVDKFGKDLERIATEHSALHTLVDKNFAIQQNQELGMEKKDIENYIKDKVSKECDCGMQKFAEDVTNMVNDFSMKQKKELKKSISDELIGKLAIKELDLEVKMKNKFDEKFKSFSQNIENKMAAKFNQETAENKIAFEKWSIEKLNDKVKTMRNDFEKSFRLFLNQRCQIYKEEISDIMHEDVNDKLDECTRNLTNYIKRELEVKIALQREFLLKRILQEIKTKSEQYKTEVLDHVEKTMLTKLKKQEEELKAKFLEHINFNMKATENEFCEHFSEQINEGVNVQFQELHSILSEEFNNEITLMEGHIQEQYETGLKLEKDIESLDTRYLGKTDFLLEKYSTTFIWPIADFLDKVKMLERGEITEVESDNFVVKECNMLMKAKLTWRLSSVHLMLGFLPSEEQRPVYHHRRSVWLLDQRDNVDDRNHRVRIKELHFGSKWIREWMDGFCPLGIQLFPSVEEIARSHFVKDGTAVVKILIEPLAILYKSMSSNNGILVWKIENVSRIIQDEKSGVIEHVCSPFFYSSPNGYRMQLAVYFSKPFVSFYLHFLSGQFDAFLPPIFYHKTTFMILDQSNSTEEKHLTGTTLISHDTYSDFVTNFAPRSVILGNSIPNSVIDPPTPVYLKNDALLIKVIVEPVATGIKKNE